MFDVALNAFYWMEKKFNLLLIEIIFFKALELNFLRKN